MSFLHLLLGGFLFTTAGSPMITFEALVKKFNLFVHLSIPLGWPSDPAGWPLDPSSWLSDPFNWLSDPSSWFSDLSSKPSGPSCWLLDPSSWTSWLVAAALLPFEILQHQVSGQGNH